MSSITRALSQPAAHRRLALPAAAALIALAVVHLLDGPGSLRDTPYVGVLELALAAACVPLAAILIARPVPAIWRTVGALTALALAAFIASRTVGLASATDDIGNWAQPLGIANLAIEFVALAAAIGGLRAPRR